ncbi:MAG: SidJ-related pseudokinase [Desulfosoma sp.]
MRAAHRELEQLKRELSGPPSDFTAAFLKTQDLRRLVQHRPEVLDHGTVRLLGKILTHEPYQAQRQAYFFSRETAFGIRDLMERSPRPDVVEHARRMLERLCMESRGACQRAACEALGTLPLGLAPPDLPPDPDPWCAPVLSWQQASNLSWAPGSWDDWHVCGRSFWRRETKTGKILVIKTAKDPESAQALFREIQWMRLLHEKAEQWHLDTAQIPSPLNSAGPGLFRVDFSTREHLLNLWENTHEEAPWAIVFMAPAGYFDYPNQPINGLMPSKATFLSVMVRNARMLGRLASHGVVHTAPIPLFHNRVQGHRREDGGLYRWPRAGRLDRWLASCDYPNFGQSGLRDLEHLEPAETNGVSFYEHIGAHFLSFFLVCGSYFRNRDPSLRGRQNDGTPVDVREWFDKTFLMKVLESIFQAYYEAFTGLAAPTDISGNLGGLVDRMIEEMGVDRHMEEILRVADQNNMTDHEFWAFLEERGYSATEARRFVRGREDVVLLTGPHLGAFNDRISLPEMIQFVGAAAALCISGRFFHIRNTARCVGSSSV